MTARPPQATCRPCRPASKKRQIDISESHNRQTSHHISVFFFIQLLQTNSHHRPRLSYSIQFYLPLVRLVHLLTLYVFSLPLQNVSKGEINRFHIALYFLTHAHSLPSQALPYFLLSDWARSHFYPFPSDWVTSPPNNLGLLWPHCILHTLISHSHAQKQDPHHAYSKARSAPWNALVHST